VGYGRGDGHDPQAYRLIIHKHPNATTPNPPRIATTPIAGRLATMGENNAGAMAEAIMAGRANSPTRVA